MEKIIFKNRILKMKKKIMIGTLKFELEALELWKKIMKNAM